MSEERHRFALLPPEELEKIDGILSSAEKTDEMVRDVLHEVGFKVGEIPEFQLLHAKIAIKMYLLTEITWVRENFVCYPAHPAVANLSAQEAAEQKVWMSGIGFNHYSGEIGAIHYVKDLARIVRETVEELLAPAPEGI